MFFIFLTEILNIDFITATELSLFDLFINVYLLKFQYLLKFLIKHLIIGFPILLDFRLLKVFIKKVLFSNRLIYLSCPLKSLKEFL